MRADDPAAEDDNPGGAYARYATQEYAASAGRAAKRNGGGFNR